MSAVDLLLVLTDQSWRADAACRGMDTELFFPSRGSSVLVDRAREVCAQCPVRKPCRDYAIENGEHFGVWGGTAERERRYVRRRLGLEVAS